ncbi:MAG: TonB-dependent receptor, partial [Deltaproteobacteria bacterium]
GGDTPFGKTIVLLNGIKLNSPDMSPMNWLEIPLGDIERIEIVRGSSSVLYGDAAIAGVINIITKPSKEKTTAVISSAFGSYGLHNEKVSTSGYANNLSFSLNGENLFSLGYQKRSTVSSQSASAGFNYDIKEGSIISGAISFNRMDYEMPGSLTKDEMAIDRQAYQPARTAYWTPAHDNDDASQDSLRANLKTSISLQKNVLFDVDYALTHKGIKSNMVSLSTYTDTYQHTYSIMPKLIFSNELLQKQNKLTIGIDFYNEPFSLDKYADKERKTKTSLADISKETLGYYLHDELNIVSDRLFLSGGYRQDRCKISAIDTILPSTIAYDTSKLHHAEAYELGTTLVLPNKSKVFVKYSTAYRFPFIDEQVYYYGFGGSDQFLTTLEKEQSKSLEAGFETYIFGSLKIGLNIFRTDMENEIRYNPSTYTNENLDNSRHEGVEITASYPVANWSKFYGSYSYHRATFVEGQYNGKELPLVPNNNLILSAEFYLPHNITLKPDCHFVSNSYMSGDNTNSAEKLDGYHTYNFFVFFKPKMKRISISAFVGVENITGTEYSTYAITSTAWGPTTYYPMPERTFKGGVHLSF